MTPFVFSSALRDYLRPQRLFAWVGVVAMVWLISRVWGALAADLSAIDSFGRVNQAVVLRVAALVAAVFGTMVINHEVEQKTIVYLLTRPVPRWQLLLGRMLAAWVVALVVSVCAELVAGAAVLGTGVFTSGRLFADIAVLALGLAAYTGLFVLLSLTLSRSLIVSLLFAFGWETFVPNMPGDMYYVSILTYMRSAGPHTVVAGGPSLGDVLTGALNPKTVEPGLAWAVLIVMTLVLWGLCQWRFSRFEFSPKEEGD